MTWTQAEIETGHFRLDNQCGSPTTKLIMIIDNEKFESVSHDRNLVLKLREGLKKQKKVDLSTIGWLGVSWRGQNPQKKTYSQNVL